MHLAHTVLNKIVEASLWLSDCQPDRTLHLWHVMIHVVDGVRSSIEEPSGFVFRLARQGACTICTMQRFEVGHLTVSMCHIQDGNTLSLLRIADEGAIM